MEERRISRRDFLKAASLIPLIAPVGFTVAKNSIFQLSIENLNRKFPNILIVVFDALSAINMSLYGYPRKTTPNIEQFAKRATVYNRHYSAGNFTIPGTNSLLTGAYPWSHRAFNLGVTVAKEYVDRNVFNLFASNGYSTTAFSHNNWAQWQLFRFGDFLNHPVRDKDFFLVYEDELPNFFSGDLILANQAVSLFFSDSGPERYDPLQLINQLRKIIRDNWLPKELRERFPRGIPSSPDSFRVFLLEDAIDRMVSYIENIPKPYLGYFHFFPPHHPYNTRQEFVDLFLDNRTFPSKPEHFSVRGKSEKELEEFRRHYDEFISYVDAEFGRLHRILDQKGMLDDTVVILTSDHGELFERGILGHVTPVLYDPVVRIPLLISQPGQTQRRDVHVPTSSVDLLPSLLNFVNKPIPDWCEGKILPGLGGYEDPSRSIYAVDAKGNSKFKPINRATFATIKDRFKLISYHGHPDWGDKDELYDLRNDPDELVDISSTKSKMVKNLRDELFSILSEREHAIISRG